MAEGGGIVSKNTNCLEDIQCPKCGNEDNFKVEGTSLFEVSDDGTGWHGDVHWDDDSLMICVQCDHRGKWKDFMRPTRPHLEHFRDIDPGAFQESAQGGAAHMQAWAHEGDV